MKKINTHIPVLVGMLALFSTGAQAACYFKTGGAQPVNINFGNVTVQRDAPVGTVLANVEGRILDHVVNCSGSVPVTHSARLTLFTTPSGYGGNVYNTNIVGVGIRITHYSDRFPFQKGYANNVSLYTSGVGATATLIKTSAGPVGSGALRTGQIATRHFDSLLLTYVNLTGVNTITPVACSVTQTAISVPMGNVLRSEFTGVGSVATSKAFSIPLNCDKDTRVKITLDATADSSGRPGVIALNPSTSDKVASGVGVQVLRNGTPVTLGSALQVGTVAATGVYTVPLTARYYQTLANVTAGQANATATFTMTYN